MTIWIAIMVLGLISFAVRIAPLATPKRFRESEVVSIFAAELPAALMVLLVIQSFHFHAPWVPQLLGLIMTAAVHLWRKHMLFSIACGMAAYIISSQVIA